MGGNRMININPEYKQFKLYFDEALHKYTDNCNNEYLSVTTFLHKFVPEFDKEFWSKKKAEEQKVSQKVILDQWNTITKKACDMGNVYHNSFEDGIKEYSKFLKAIKYLNTDSNQMVTVADLDTIDANTKQLDLDSFIKHTDNKYPEVYDVFRFYLDKGYKIYSEIGAFLPNYLISGTIDLLFIKDDGFIIGDWKTNRRGISFKSGYYKKDKSTKPAQETNEFVSKFETLQPPLGHLLNCNGNIYSLQLNMYAIMVHLITGLPCKGTILCHIEVPFILNDYGRPKRFSDGYKVDESKKECAKWYKIQFMQNEIIQILEERRQLIKKDVSEQQLSLFEFV
jgi:hypothetical protein